VQSVLRALIHLDVADEKGVVRDRDRGVRAVVDAIVVGGDAGRGGEVHRVAADAADHGHVGHRIVGKSWREVAEVLRGLDVQDVALRGGEGRDRDRHVLDLLFAFLSDDHQFAYDRAALSGGPRGAGGCISGRVGCEGLSQG
jgi:hypothetical protein